MNQREQEWFFGKVRNYENLIKQRKNEMYARKIREIIKKID